MPHQLRFPQRAIYTCDFPPQEMPYMLIAEMELQVLMASEAQGQHLLWAPQIPTRKRHLICGTCPAGSLQTP